MQYLESEFIDFMFVFDSLHDLKSFFFNYAFVHSFAAILHDVTLSMNCEVKINSDILVHILYLNWISLSYVCDIKLIR